ncbi:hypothetical protein OG352_38140 [Streptomyces sp. NBC_01485]|uniref:hypothetical protein n=1 Tax=Streptomyces sp. NBC_01485 TaxID=2903884 RepID=UPI002E2EBBFB|nr:hypothetical protein [Streptomyces sp. NBC_01485]
MFSSSVTRVMRTVPGLPGSDDRAAARDDALAGDGAGLGDGQEVDGVAGGLRTRGRGRI